MSFQRLFTTCYRPYSVRKRNPMTARSSWNFGQLISDGKDNIMKKFRHINNAKWSIMNVYGLRAVRGRWWPVGYSVFSITTYVKFSSLVPSPPRFFLFFFSQSQSLTIRIIRCEILLFLFEKVTSVYSFWAGKLTSHPLAISVFSVHRLFLRQVFATIFLRFNVVCPNERYLHQFYVLFLWFVVSLFGNLTLSVNDAIPLGRNPSDYKLNAANATSSTHTEYIDTNKNNYTTRRRKKNSQNNEQQTTQGRKKWRKKRARNKWFTLVSCIQVQQRTAAKWNGICIVFMSFTRFKWMRMFYWRKTKRKKQQQPNRRKNVGENGEDARI